MSDLINRDEFKAWWLHDDQRELRLSCAEGWGFYIWTHSRSAIEVELPMVLMPVEVDHHSDLPLMQGGAVIASIESLGLKVKP